LLKPESFENQRNGGRFDRNEVRSFETHLGANRNSPGLGVRRVSPHRAAAGGGASPSHGLSAARQRAQLMKFTDIRPTTVLKVNLSVDKSIFTQRSAIQLIRKQA
jgi:hypothetical protein